MTCEMLTTWLVETCTPEELADGVWQLFLERGPRLSRRMRRDVKLFLADRSSRALAECLAMNRRVVDETGFAAWCRERAEEEVDDHGRFGVRRRDFSADRGPGAARSH
ncbi:MAG TPA: hypothetical protein VMX57_06185 [Planctomycetota bacterium]|nr:hypothetical protein [Planctomycetota bacterium]